MAPKYHPVSCISYLHKPLVANVKLWTEEPMFWLYLLLVHFAPLHVTAVTPELCDILKINVKLMRNRIQLKPFKSMKF